MLLSEDGEFVFVQIGDSLIDPETSRSLCIDTGVNAIVGIPVSSEIKDSEKEEILLLTEKMIGCKVASIGEEPLESKESEDVVMKDKKEELKAVLSKTAVEEGAKEAKSDEASVVTYGAPPAPKSPTAPDAFLAAPEVPASDPPAAPAAPVAPDAPAPEAPPAPEKLESVVVTTDPPSVAPEEVLKKKGESAARTPEVVALEKVLTDSDVINRIASVLSQTVMGSLHTAIDGLQGIVARLTEAATKHTDILAAQAKAVEEILSATPAMAMAKSAVAEVVADPKKEDTLENLQKMVAELQAGMQTLRKTAVTGTVVNERKEKGVVTSVSPLPAGFLGLK